MGAFRGILLDLLVTGDRARGGRAVDHLATAVVNEIQQANSRSTR